MSKLRIRVNINHIIATRSLAEETTDQVYYA